MSEELLRLEKVSKYYVNGKNVVAGLNRVSLTLHRGEFVAITGESGSGKSTLGHILSGILPYEDGEMYFRASPTSHFDSVDWENYRKDHISFISQNYGILPGATVIDHVISALRLTGMDKTQAKNRALEILEEVELSDVRDRRAAKLSSGQKQRLSIARALAKPCPILIADEPTGNLDPENSEKVIRLLARAARERLVILITHEYAEAADFVTRHIQLQDGSICADAQLRPIATCERTEHTKKPRQRLAPYIAGIQLRSRPAWCMAVLLFFVLTAFTVFVFLGSFIIALDDTSTRIFETEAFRNGAMDRIAAVRADGKAMEQSDYGTILGLKYVEALERYGYVADVNYSYREGVDYQKHYTMRNYGSPIDPMYMEVESVEVYQSKQFIKTVPLLAEGASFLTAGRLPENFYEIVAVGSADQIGQTVTVYLKDFSNWSMSEYIQMEATVVGVTDLGSGLYFHDDVAKMLTVKYTDLWGGSTLFPANSDIYSEVEFVDYYEHPSKNLFFTEYIPTENAVLRPLGDSEVLIAHPVYVYIFQNAYFTGSKYEYLYSRTIRAGIGKLNIAGVHDCPVSWVYGVSPNTFHRMIDFAMPNCGDQVSLTIQDYAYTDRVIDALEKEGYLAVSPYVLGSAKVDETLAEKRVQTLTISLGALFAVIVLQLIVLRALFHMENDAYAIFSSIGLPYRTARNSLWLQILCFTVLGQLLGLGGMWVCSQLGIQRIVNVTKHLPLAYWAVLCAVHLVSSLCVAWIVIRNLRKRVYPISSRQGDLALEDEEEAAV